MSDYIFAISFPKDADIFYFIYWYSPKICNPDICTFKNKTRSGLANMPPMSDTRAKPGDEPGFFVMHKKRLMSFFSPVFCITFIYFQKL